MPRKISHEEFVKRVQAVSPDIIILGELVNTASRIKVQCSSCGKIWEPAAKELLNGKGCRQCRIKAFAKSRTKTDDQFRQELQEVNRDVTVLEPYVNSHTALKTRCNICGHEWKITPKDLLHGYGCKKCSSKRAAEKRKISAEEYYHRVKEKNPNLKILDSYNSLHSILRVKCDVCNHIWTASGSNLLYNATCPFCSKERIAGLLRKSKEQFLKEATKIQPLIKVLGTYQNIDTPIECECLVCKTRFEKTPYSLLKGHGCPRCSRSGTSFMEQFIFWAFATVLGEEKVLSRDRKTIKMELDIYIPDLHFAVEPGAWPLHKNSVSRDKAKRDKCREQGIRLITVYDVFPRDLESPFEDDCIVYQDDYNNSDRKNIRSMVMRLFEYAGVMKTFAEEEWTRIEELAYENAKAKNTEDFIEEINSMRSDIIILGTYSGSKVPIETECVVCGNRWNVRPNSLLNGAGCPVCSRRRNGERQTKSHEQYVAEVEEKQPSITILGHYTKGKDHIKAQCGVCGTVWSPVAASLLTGEGCPTCGLIKKANGRRKTHEQFVQELFQKNPDIEVLGKYLGCRESIAVKCKICGYEWTRQADKLLTYPHHKYESKYHKNV